MIHDFRHRRAALLVIDVQRECFDREGRAVPHDTPLAHRVAALGAGFAEIVTTDEALSRLV